MTKTNLQRYVWIDYVKAIGIFLIVYGHAEITKLEFSFLWTFHVPLFFLVSGFLSVKDHNQLDIRKKIDRLLLPYIYIYLI
ncbi:acyltransferase family protein, partial [Sphaerospermopsis aphanizomenoides BCCUSP55]|uniref:acyltransferase family protein n=1 Tax=Sphaerospermopsis aphanizomenoides TaxID=459663 RepID=UPI001904BEFC